jgi:hypothetical protein
MLDGAQRAPLQPGDEDKGDHCRGRNFHAAPIHSGAGPPERGRFTLDAITALYQEK